MKRRSRKQDPITKYSHEKGRKYFSRKRLDYSTKTKPLKGALLKAFNKNVEQWLKDHPGEKWSQEVGDTVYNLTSPEYDEIETKFKIITQQDPDITKGKPVLEQRLVKTTQIQKKARGVFEKVKKSMEERAKQGQTMTAPSLEVKPPAQVVQAKKRKRAPPPPPTTPSFSQKKIQEAVEYLKNKPLKTLAKTPERMLAIQRAKEVKAEQKIEESKLTKYADELFKQYFNNPFDKVIGDLMDALNSDRQQHPSVVDRNFDILNRGLARLNDGATMAEIDDLFKSVLQIGVDMENQMRAMEAEIDPDDYVPPAGTFGPSKPNFEEEEEKEDPETEEELAPVGPATITPSAPTLETIKSMAKDLMSKTPSVSSTASSFISDEISSRTGLPPAVVDPVVRRVMTGAGPPSGPAPRVPPVKPDKLTKPKMFDDIELKFGDANVKPSGHEVVDNPDSFPENQVRTKPIRYGDKFPEIPYDDTRSARITLGMIKNPIRDPFKLTLFSRNPLIQFNGQVLEDGADAQEAVSIFQTENFGRLPDYDKVRPETLSMYGNPTYKRLPMMGY